MREEKGGSNCWQKSLCPATQWDGTGVKRMKEGEKRVRGSGCWLADWKRRGRRRRGVHRFSSKVDIQLKSCLVLYQIIA